MAPRKWFWVCLALIAVLWLAGGGESSTEIEGGLGSGSVCEQDIVYFVNITITNDDAAAQRYRVTLTAFSLDFEPATGFYDLLYGESATFRSQAVVSQGRTPDDVMVEITLRITMYGTDDIGSSERDMYIMVRIPECALPVVTARETRVVGKVGEAIPLRFTVTNRGNHAQVIDVGLEGVPGEWEVRITGKTNLSLAVGETHNLTVYVTPDYADTVMLRLVGQTTFPSPDGFDYAEVTVSVEPRSYPLLLGLLALAAALGAVVYLGRSRWWNSHASTATGTPGGER